MTLIIPSAGSVGSTPSPILIRFFSFTMQDSDRRGFWTYKLHAILRPASRATVPSAVNSPSMNRHPAGEIWRHVLSKALYEDLRRADYGLRRFVRLEHWGLSGTLLYDIPVSLVSVPDGVVEKGVHINLKTVFGDMGDSKNHGMHMDDLLDAIGGKVVYFPSYACTSFIVSSEFDGSDALWLHFLQIGQTMKAFFLEQPALCPIPTQDGFSVANVDANGPPDFLSQPPLDVDLSSVGFMDGDDGFFSGSHYLSDLTDTFLRDRLDQDDPLLALCVRTSKFGLTRDSPSDGEESDDSLKEDSDSSLSTIDSAGLITPLMDISDIDASSDGLVECLHSKAAPGDTSIFKVAGLVSFLDVEEGE